MQQKKVGKTFIKHIPYIETIIFSAGSYFSGHEVTTVRFQDDRASIRRKAVRFRKTTTTFPGKRCQKLSS